MNGAADISTQATFRDPEGFCFGHRGRIFRVIHPGAADRVRALLDAPFIRRLMSEGRVPQTRLVDGADAGLPSNFVQEPGGLLLEHDRIAFPSFAHEWPPEMLHAAGDFTLKLQLEALQHDFTLKDASPSNVLFRGNEPVFVDLLSFVPRTKGTDIWIAYAQFVRNFVLPLLLHRSRNIAPHEIFLARRDGLEPEEVYAQLPALSRMGWTAFEHVTLPTWLGSSRKAATAGVPAPRPGGDDERAKAVAQMLVERVQRTLHKLRPSTAQSSKWSAYMDTTSYRDSAFAAKEEFVRTALEAVRPARVLDVGCNTGHFSAMAAEAGAAVVAIDYDPVVVGKVWHAACSRHQSILPLVVNLARPSPGLGWRNEELTPFLRRSQQGFDFALLLAVIHHLTITDGVPLNDVFRLVAECVTQGAIVEFVPAADPMFVQIVRNKEHLIQRLGQAEFERAFAREFDLVRQMALPNSGRIMYWLRKKAAAT